MRERRSEDRVGGEAGHRYAEQSGAGTHVKLAAAIIWLMLALLIPQPQLDAQCAFVGSGTGTINGTQKTVHKTYNFPAPSGTCVVTDSSNVVQCLPVFTAYSAANYLFRADRMMTAAPTAFCQWLCGACTIRIDQTDGLPVELMEFTADDGAPEGEETGSQKDGGESPQG